LRQGIVDLTEKLDNATATAAYVTSVASSLEEVRDADKSEIEIFVS
jgi:hypothetical protein